MCNKLNAIVHKHWEKLIVTGHVGYFSAAFFEAHGTYAILAGVMAVVITIGSIFHLGTGE